MLVIEVRKRSFRRVAFAITDYGWLNIPIALIAPLWRSVNERRGHALTPNHKMTPPIGFAILLRMDVERIIDDIQQLEEMFEAADIRPLTEADISAANRRHDETLAQSPWFKLWRHYGICCRSETPVIQLPE